MPSQSPSTLKPWEIVERRRVGDYSPWFEVWKETVKLPDGRLIKDFYRIEQADYVEVFAVTDAHKIVGIWHYKHGPGRVSLGIPAGFVKPGEPPLETARRELLEESGFQAGQWEHLGTFATDGNRGGGNAHIFMASGLRQVADPCSGDLEEIQVEQVAPVELTRLMQEGHVATLAGALAIVMGLNRLSQTTGD